MPRRPSPEHRPESTPSTTPASPLGLPEDQLARWAELIAQGQARFPDGLTPAQLEALAEEVRRLRRLRLVSWIARAVAHDLYRDSEPSCGD